MLASSDGIHILDQPRFLAMRLDSEASLASNEALSRANMEEVK
jgi:hypothetical protein